MSIFAEPDFVQGALADRASLISAAASSAFYRVIAAKRGRAWKRNDIARAFGEVPGSYALHPNEFPMFRNAFIAAFRALQDPADVELADQIEAFFNTQLHERRTA